MKPYSEWYRYPTTKIEPSDKICKKNQDHEKLIAPGISNKLGTLQKRDRKENREDRARGKLKPESTKVEGTQGSWEKKWGSRDESDTTGRVVSRRFVNEGRRRERQLTAS